MSEGSFNKPKPPPNRRGASFPRGGAPPGLPPRNPSPNNQSNNRAQSVSFGNTGTAAPPVRGGGSGIQRGKPPTPSVRGKPPQRPTSQPPKKLIARTSSRKFDSGFIAKQQQKGDNPNVMKFFQHIALEMLKNGLKIPSDNIEIFSNVTENHLQTIRAKQLLSTSDTQFLLKTIHEIQHFLAEQRHLEQIIIIQSAVRRWQIQRKYGKILYNETEKQRVISRNTAFLELLKTEEKFVESLEEIIQKYVIPLRHSDFIEPQEGAHMFCNIETVVEEHKKLQNKLIEAKSNWPFLANIGKIFLDIKPLLTAISVYVGHFKTAINEIERIKREKPRFAQFIDRVDSQSEIDLCTSLLLPVNRISNYDICIHNLNDFLLLGTQEREDCENASAVLKQSSIVIQKSLVESGNAANLLKIKQKIQDKGPSTLIIPGRVFIQEWKFKKHFVCLFTDIILIATKAVKAKELHKLKATINLNKSELKIESSK